MPTPEQLAAAWSDVELEVQRRIRLRQARIRRLRKAGQPVKPWRRAEIDRLEDLLAAARERRRELPEL